MNGFEALEAELVDLGRHLAIGDDRVAADVRPSSRNLAQRSFRIAAAILVIGAAIVIYAPARHAIARLFGIGTVELRPVTTTLPLPTATTSGAAPGSGAAAGFSPLRAPDPLTSETIDQSVGSGMVILRYDKFTLYEIQSAESTVFVLTKLVPQGTRQEYVKVRGVDAVWISGEPHQVAVAMGDAGVVMDTVRMVGNVLLWYEAGVTIRIEGADSLDEARAIAESLR